MGFFNVGRVEHCTGLYKRLGRSIFGNTKILSGQVWAAGSRCPYSRKEVGVVGPASLILSEMFWSQIFVNPVVFKSMLTDRKIVASNQPRGFLPK